MLFSCALVCASSCVFFVLFVVLFLIKNIKSILIFKFVLFLVLFSGSNCAFFVF